MAENTTITFTVYDVEIVEGEEVTYRTAMMGALSNLQRWLALTLDTDGDSVTLQGFQSSLTVTRRDN